MAALLYLLQRKMLYFPVPEPNNSAYHSIAIKSGDLIIKVVSVGTDTGHAVIYFGGNAESAWMSPSIMQAALSGYATYYVNYPGYGGSTGAPSETSILHAASDVYKYVSERHDKVSLVGRSLGTGVAVAVASNYQVASMVLISPYDSIASVAASHYPIFPTSLLVKDSFDSLSRSEQVNTNVLVLIASDDQIIPPKHSHNLVASLENASSSRVETQVLENYHHNNIDAHPSFDAYVKQFLVRY